MNDKPIAVSTWRFGLKSAAKAGELSAAGAPPLDCIEQAIRIVEDDPEVTSVGYGGLPNEQGEVELDASVFDGPNHKIGCVAGLKHIRNPISVARLVMEKTEYTMLAGEGALEFALQNGFTKEDLVSPRARERWERWRLEHTSPFELHPFEEGYPDANHDTICLLLRDPLGNLYGGVSTSGLAWKLPGRVGDSPIIGAGLYIHNEVGAAAATGVGELAIAECASFAIVELMRQQYDPQEACRIVLDRVIADIPMPEPRQLGLIALRKDGKIGYGALQPGFQAAIHQDDKSFLVDVDS